MPNVYPICVQTLSAESGLTVHAPSNDDVMGMRILTVHILGLRLFR